MTTLLCPLCQSDTPANPPFSQDKRRNYYRCNECELVFVSPADYPSPSQERHEYSLHENAMDDPGYARFLNKLAEPLTARLSSGQSGLDFGCGPAPLLAAMLEQQGMIMAIYDPIFFNDDAALHHTYDFITCTEAIEHFHRPQVELAKLTSMLRPGGWLAIMTKRVINRERFSSWHYKNDPTHVCFFSEATFRYWSAKHGLSVQFPGPDTVLMQKLEE